ncbi:MAG: hypothetical protein JWP97_667 [Labilithrix sp.]|nr:hypothetical protein [Labilithrix sp.]
MSGARLVLVLALVVAGASGCGGGKPPPKTTTDVDAVFEAAIAAEKAQDLQKESPKASASPRALATAKAQPPFTSEQIRAATRNGRTYRYRVEVPGKAPRERVLTFAKVDDSGAELLAGGDGPRRIGWTQLQKDAEFPRDKVSIHEESSVKLPGGKFDCLVYELRGDGGETWTYYFAKTLPGAPVLFFTEVGGRRVKTTTLLQHIPGRDS